MEDKVTKGGRTRRTAATKTTTTTKAPATAAAKSAATRPAAAPGKVAAPRKVNAPREVAAAPAEARATAARPDRAELVRLAAYFRAERRGFAAGHEVDDWLAAELEVAAQLGAAPAAARKAPSRKPRQA